MASCRGRQTPHTLAVALSPGRASLWAPDCTPSPFDPLPSPQVYVGNYEYDADERDLEQAFKKYGPVKSMEYKSGRPPPLPP